jgi:hypothetical protein
VSIVYTTLISNIPVASFINFIIRNFLIYIFHRTPFYVYFISSNSFRKECKHHFFQMENTTNTTQYYFINQLYITWYLPEKYFFPKINIFIFSKRISLYLINKWNLSLKKSLKNIRIVFIYEYKINAKHWNTKYLFIYGKLWYKARQNKRVMFIIKKRKLFVCILTNTSFVLSR